MSDLIARAELILANHRSGHPWHQLRPGDAAVLSELLAALKAKDAELEKVRAEVLREHGLFTQEAAATNRRVSEAWQAGFVEGQRR